MKPKLGNEYDVQTVPFITDIPINAIKLEIIVTVIDEDTEEIFNVSSKMNIEDIREGMISGDEWESENIKYKLADDYLEKLNELEKKAK